MSQTDAGVNDPVGCIKIYFTSEIIKEPIQRDLINLVYLFEYNELDDYPVIRALQ
jgi:hypothetical protein